MRNKHLFIGIAASMGMLVLILDGKTALLGAQTGIDLCLRTVIPSLFPFFLLSILVTSSLAGSAGPLLRPVGRLCAIPRGAESILVSGFLGGYPVGAQSIASAYRSGSLFREDAERMLAFCSNAGPAFLFGMIGPMFSDKAASWILWGIHIASALLVSLLIPVKSVNAAKMKEQTSVSLPAALSSALVVTATVCGWVILFRVVIAFFSRWALWLLPPAAQVAVMGALELSNGCCSLAMVESEGMRFVICSGMLAWGGLCVAMQTVSVVGELSLRFYFLGKILQTAISVLLSGAFVYGLWLPCVVLIAVLAVVLRAMQKKSSIPKLLGV